MTRTTVGSDPEMVLMRGKHAVDPRHYVMDDLHRVGDDVGNVELRPIQSEDVQVHVANIHNAMASIAQHLRDLPGFHLRAGTGWRSHVTGGHIHLGTGRQLMEERCRLVEVLDYVVGVPLLLQCTPEGVMRRRTQGYGSFSEWRPQDHGVEYRTPASWLVVPKSTTAALALAKVVVDSTHMPRMMENAEQALRESGFITNREMQLRAFETTKQILTELDAYPAYKTLIDPLFKRIERGKRWWEQRDALVNWHLRPATRNEVALVEPPNVSQTAPTTTNPQITGSPHDNNCVGIAQAVAMNNARPWTCGAYIYGLREDREYHIIVGLPVDRNHVDVRQNVRNGIGGYSTGFGLAPSLRRFRAGDIYIGLRRGLRDNISQCENIVRRILVAAGA
ncbi:MAG: hypothetical protein HY376_02005 [Candidatus Blackburnbacteria bacterium]|nr:hypothetical protein [Candidatus Blackburnbacteria bacterium]